ncbi:MAG: hypothetical protein ACF8SC_11755, partial [Phycisphaerales bacterium JB037]
MTEIGHFINNARVAGTSGRSQPVWNPATGQSEKTVALASAEEVGRGVPHRLATPTCPGDAGVVDE